jgi:hypothetical protein
MKTMLFTLGLCLISLVSFSQTTGRLEFEITGETTMSELAQIKSELMERGAMFNMYNLKFDEEGRLTAISVKVDFLDGNKGTASKTNFSDGSSIRIIRDYDSKEKPFCIGDCPK